MPTRSVTDSGADSGALLADRSQILNPPRWKPPHSLSISGRTLLGTVEHCGDETLRRVVTMGLNVTFSASSTDSPACTRDGQPIHAPGNVPTQYSERTKRNPGESLKGTPAILQKETKETKLQTPFVRFVSFCSKLWTLGPDDPAPAAREAPITTVIGCRRSLQRISPRHRHHRSGHTVEYS